MFIIANASTVRTGVLPRLPAGGHQFSRERRFDFTQMPRSPGARRRTVNRSQPSNVTLGAA
jgi:hypothetical protein